MRVEASADQSPRQRSVVVAGRFKGDVYLTADALQVANQTIMIGSIIGHRHAVAFAAWAPDQDLVAPFGNVDGYQRAELPDIVVVGHGSMLPE